MTDAAPALSPADENRALIRIGAGAAIFAGAFLSGFVIAEPAPYEVYLAGLIGIWALFGLRLPAAIAPLIALLVLLNLGRLVSMLTMPDWGQAPLHLAVSTFLAITAMFFAAVIAADHRRLGNIMAGYMAAAVLTATLGIVGYFGLVPGTEVFTRYGRAMGAFQDPNVFAPFLALPATWCLYGVLTRPVAGALWRLVPLTIVSFAIFLSFSRAGWGLYVVCALLLTTFVLAASPSRRYRLRVFLMATGALAAVTLALLVAVQFDVVRDMLVERARLVQDYDGARLGRFARHAIGLLAATEQPLGTGVLQFGHIYGEDPHNIFLKTLTDYSWLGFAAYLTLVVWTLGAGLRIAFRDRPWQPYLVCALVVFFGHMLVGLVIDTDHWRHFFLLLGMIWGCIALEARHSAANPQTPARY
ncbi:MULTISPECIES: O-antigen ligase family protein [unclassified Roseitalea]|uniref:O-antigen ligase family protein n=1 Tax=unclassified Roseitalea TaxID=2639107 RepID=UPI00273FAB57|nr:MULTISPECIES: O-antigen ligase family protein [unclassified Roseitalea]